MKRPSSLIIALLVCGAFVFLAVTENQNRREVQAARAAAERDAEFTAARKAAAAAAEITKEVDPAEIAASPAPPSPLELGMGRFAKMPDGSRVPALPTSAPQKLKLGVALFRYKGAQAPPPTSRSRKEALELATKAARVAGEDFEQAVKMGDQGSSENLGWMQRGVLEPAVEYAVFSLDKGEIAQEPIDTPRGFWVVKRVR